MPSADGRQARAAGIQPGIQLAASIGHADSLILPRDGIAWQCLVGADGLPALRQFPLGTAAEPGIGVGEQGLELPGLQFGKTCREA